MLLGLTASLANAALYSVDLVRTDTTAVSGDIAGGLTGQTGLWNRLVGSSMPAALGNLTDGTGGTSTVGFTAAYSGGDFKQFQGYGTSNTVLAADNPERLDISGPTATLTFAFTNLAPGGSYTLAVFNTAPPLGIITINGGTPHTGLTDILITSEVADANGKITGVATYNGGIHTEYLGLSGFQLKSAAIPEPSVFWLLGLTGLGLIRRRRN